MFFKSLSSPLGKKSTPKKDPKFASLRDAQSSDAHQGLERTAKFPRVGRGDGFYEAFYEVSTSTIDGWISDYDTRRTV